MTGEAGWTGRGGYKAPEAPKGRKWDFSVAIAQEKKIGGNQKRDASPIIKAQVGLEAGTGRHLEHGASRAASAGEGEEVSAVLTVDHPKESCPRITITLVPISFATLAVRPPENQREMVNTNPPCHHFSSSF